MMPRLGVAPRVEVRLLAAVVLLIVTAPKPVFALKFPSLAEKIWAPARKVKTGPSC